MTRQFSDKIESIDHDDKEFYRKVVKELEKLREENKELKKEIKQLKWTLSEQD